MSEHAPNTQTPRPTGAAQDHAGEHGHADDGSHEIAGFRVGVNPVPFSAVIVFLFILFIAIVSWIPTYGF